MKVSANTTVAELMKRFPDGFAVGPGEPDNPGELSRVLAASSHLRGIVSQYPVLEGNQGYMIVDMDEEKDK